MSAAELYQSKVCGADEAVDCIQSDSHLAMGMATAEPPALLRALAERVERRELTNLKLWYFHSMEHAARTILRGDLLDRVQPHCMFLSSVERSLMRLRDPGQGSLIEFVPTAFSESSRLLSERVKLDAFVTTVSPMDRHGYFTFGTSNDYGSTAARSASRLIVEVNKQMPRVLGDALLHVSEVDAIVENDAPLPEIAAKSPTPEDETIARTIASMIDNGSCLQMGIGSLPNAVCARLSGHRDLGIHTELMSPGLAGLVRSGAVTNRLKNTYPGRSVFTFAMGDRLFYEFLDDNPSMQSLPVQVVNDPRLIAKNDDVVSVNATLQVDLSGACNSEHMMGSQYSGAGGQLDFVRGAAGSARGKSIIACRSTAQGGTISRIVPVLDGPVTTPRNDTDIIVTEFGAVTMKGKSLRERASALIGIAHPRFREELAAGSR